jgi:hypothetical protein
MTRLQITIALSILALSAARANGQDHTDPPSAPHQTARKSQGFLDYTLGKINPANKDYGLSAGDLRAEAVHGSIDDLYFWSNLVTLGLLATITWPLKYREQSRWRRSFMGYIPSNRQRQSPARQCSGLGVL